MERYSKKYASKWQSQYSEEFKRHVCDNFLTGTLSRTEVERKHEVGHGRLTYWLKEFGYEYKKPEPLLLPVMPETSKSNQEQSASMSELKKELEDAKLLAEAYRRIIDKAEQELKIDIRKKSNTK